MTRADYEHYLQSADWAATRLRRLNLAEHQCEFREELDWHPKHGAIYGERCKETTRLEVHHLHYDSLGAERDEDLEVLCRFHHLVRHVYRRAVCEYCDEATVTDDGDAIDIVKQAVADYGGIDKVMVDALDVPGVCNACDHMLSD
jgi:hypothetical protein